MVYNFTQIVEEILSTSSTIDDPAAMSNVNDPSTSADNPSIASRVDDLKAQVALTKGAVPQLKMLAAPCCWHLLLHDSYGNRVGHRLENTI